MAMKKMDEYFARQKAHHQSNAAGAGLSSCCIGKPHKDCTHGSVTKDNFEYTTAKNWAISALEKSGDLA